MVHCSIRVDGVGIIIVIVWVIRDHEDRPGREDGMESQDCR